MYAGTLGSGSCFYGFLLTGACVLRRVAGWVGLPGVAGMMTLILSQWIIPENSLRLASTSLALASIKSHQSFPSN